MSDATYQALYAQTTREREREYAAEADAELLAAFGEVPDDGAPPPSDADRGLDCDAPQLGDEAAMRLRWLAESEAAAVRSSAWKGRAA